MNELFRSSEDIDLVQIEAGPIGSVLDAIRDVFERGDAPQHRFQLTLGGCDDVEHLMDNFGLRQAPMPMGYRQNLTHGSGSQFHLAGLFEGFEGSQHIVGRRILDHFIFFQPPL